MQPAKPIYDLDDLVFYQDRQGRLQRGEVLAIETSWRGRRGREPLIIYTLRHPTYANRRFYATDKVIIGLTNVRTGPADALNIALAEAAE